MLEFRKYLTLFHMMLKIICKVGPGFMITLTLLKVSEASLVAQLVRNLPAVQETQVQFLSWEDPLEKDRAIHSSSLVWEIPWTEEPDGLQSMGCKESDTTG